jgi:hypothetical protein
MNKLKTFVTTQVEAIGEALELLRQRDLETSYREASREADQDFDIAVADGLSDEAW